METKENVFIVMGVSNSGKTNIMKQISYELALNFI